MVESVAWCLPGRKRHPDWSECQPGRCRPGLCTGISYIVCKVFQGWFSINDPIHSDFFDLYLSKIFTLSFTNLEEKKEKC